MFQNEATAAARRVPVMLRSSTTGLYTASLTLSAAELQISINGGAYANTTGTFGEVGGSGNGSGSYYYEAAAADVTTRGYFEIKAIKTGYEPWYWITEIEEAYSTAAGLVGVQADTDDIQARLPAALIGGRMDSSVGAMAANVITAAALAADAGTELAAAVWAFAHESGRTAKGVLVRLDALMVGKATGLVGVLATFFRADGATKAIEATQDVALGTRVAASTVAGD